MDSFEVGGLTVVIGLGLVYCGGLLTTFRLRKQHNDTLKKALIQQMNFLIKEDVLDIKKLEVMMMRKFKIKLDFLGTDNGSKVKDTGNIGKIGNGE